MSLIAMTLFQANRFESVLFENIKTAKEALSLIRVLHDQCHFFILFIRLNHWCRSRISNNVRTKDRS